MNWLQKISQDQYDSMGVKVKETQFGDLDYGIADIIEQVNAKGYKSIASMSGMRSDYDRAMGRYSSDGYIAFLLKDLRPGQEQAIKAAAEKSNLAWMNSETYFWPSVVVRCGVCQSNVSRESLRIKAGEMANQQLGYTEVPKGRSWEIFKEWLDLRDSIQKQLEAAEGGLIVDDAEIRRRWEVFADAL